MAVQGDLVYKSQADILAEILAALLVRLPDANLGPDSLFRIWAEVFSNTSEGLYLGMQLLHDDMFIQTMSALALVRAGEMYGRPQKPGTLATGSVTFAGTGGTYIPLGTIVSAPRASVGDTLDFQTSTADTIPNPGIPIAPTTADGGASGGTLPNGLYEHGITFVTAAGETALGATSAPLNLGNNHKIAMTNIPLGGPGTTARNIYRRFNGGTWGFISGIADNTTTVFTDNDNTPTAQTPPTDSTAEGISLVATALLVGVDYNVAPGTITDISSGPAGLVSVTNAAAFTGGSDPEDIEAFRQALLQWVRAPQSGSAADLQAWAQSIDGVETATIFPNVDLSGAAAPGTVSVRITGTGGSIPPPALVNQVLTELLSHDLANITILVGTFTGHPINVTVTTLRSPGYAVADITPSVQQAISAYINSVPVGGTVYVAGILDAAFGLAGMVNVTTTFTDTALAPTEKATVGTITVN
jgi:Baseplate J-like protein